jgi:hypothetical protein
MHGVYVNGQKITRAEIAEKDIIAFGNKVTRAEGEYLSSGQAFNFSEYPFLTPLPATHDGVSLTVGKIVREGAIFSNSIDLTEPTKTAPPVSCRKPIPQTSYRVPDYDTDSSKENYTNTVFEQPTPVPFIDLESVPSPAPSHPLDPSEGENDRNPYYNGLDFESELGSDHEYDDEQSYSGSDGSASPYSVRVLEEDDTQSDEAGSEVDEPLESHEDTQMAPVHINDAELVQPKAMYPQVEEKDKICEVAETMSLPYILDPTGHCNTTTATLTPIVGTPPYSGLNDVESLLFSQSKENNVEDGVVDQDKEKDLESQVASLDDRQTDRELENLGLMHQIAASQSRTNELFVQSSSHNGSKRKREIEDDGHEETAAPSTERKLLKLKFNKQHVLKNLFKKSAQAGPRPSKRTKYPAARFALGTVAGAIGGVATVVGVLMTPACEELLSNWPIA